LAIACDVTEEAALIRSFQLRLALQSTLVSAAVLTVFALGLWHFVAGSQQQRMDRDLVGLAHQMLRSGNHSPEDQLVAAFGEELDGSASLLVNDHQQIIFQSKNWPPQLTAAALPHATHVDKTRLPEHSYSDHIQVGDRNMHSAHSKHISHKENNRIKPQFKTVEIEGHKWRLVGLNSDDHQQYVALDLTIFNKNQNHVLGIMILAVIMALLISAMGAWMLARRALRPLQTLTQATENITITELGQRIGDQGSDLEFARLIHVFNEMLERLDASFTQAIRFSADASHELKTPLTVMQGELESALQKAPEGSETQAAFASQLEEVQRLNNLVGKLLLLSHADSGALQPTHDQFNVTELVQRVFEDIPVLDPDLALECRLDPDLMIKGDQDLLRQAVQNLAVNAVRYNRPGGWIRCELKKKELAVVLRVSNSSDPIPFDDHEKIFHRFYQVDKARGGNHFGLGLSLAREIAQVHGGKLALSHSDDSGTMFELELPQ
jgi:two-component system, OmpR family, heavy metal sensor histidine kinase CusS